MKRILSLSALMGMVLVGCTHNSNGPVRFVPKSDSGKISYRDSTQGPLVVDAIYQTFRYFVPVGDSGVTTTGKWVIDTAWAVKIQTDTFTAKNAIHTYKYQQISKLYVKDFASHKP